MNRVYLDYNATCPLGHEARSAMIAAMDKFASGANPSSVHAEGRAAKAVVEQARRQISTLTRCDPTGIVFTSGGTEAINMALCGMARRENDPVRQIFITTIEHSAVRETALALAEAGLVQVETLPVTSDGVVDIDAAKLAFATANKPFLACIILANNETGVIQPVAQLRSDIFAHGGFLFVDGVQALGKIALDFNALQADLMSISAHKIGGPNGSGALLTKPGVALSPLIHGGGQELRRRGGTENILGIAGFGAAASAVDLTAFAQLAALRDSLQQRLEAMDVQGLKIWGAGSPRLANTLCFSAPGLKSDMAVMALDLEGVAVSAGAACSSGKVAGSKVLYGMGASEEEASSSLRVSLGHDTTQNDIDRFVRVWAKAYARATKRRAA